MRFKLLLATTGLLALVRATTNVDARDALKQREVKVAASEHPVNLASTVERHGEFPCPPCFRLVGKKCQKQPKFCSSRIQEGEDYESDPDESADVEAPGTEDEDYAPETSNDARASNPCSKHCYLPRGECVKKCKGGLECKSKCECELFSDPKSLCRVRKCVEAPDNCPSPKEVHARTEEPTTETVESNPGIPPYPGGNACPTCLTTYVKCTQLCDDNEACKDRCGCGVSGQKFCSHCGIPCKNGAVERHRDASITAPRGLPGFPTTTNQCPACNFGYDKCKKNCRPGDTACTDDCGCRFSTQFYCIGCQIPCPDSKAAIESRDDVPAGDLDTAIVGPGPNQNTCKECTWALDGCKKKCPSPGACNESCRCNLRDSKKCKGCKIPCRCGNACPRLSAAQRRFDGRSPEDGAHDANVVDTSLQIASKTCDECEAKVYQCRKDCKLHPVCKNHCNCAVQKTYPECKGCKHMPCKAVIERETVNEQSSALQNVPPGNPCNLCKASLIQCQKHCNNQSACLNYCSCMHKDVFPTCNECKLSCQPTAEIESAKEIGLELIDSVPAITARDVCDSCMSGVRLCQAQCNFDADCANACACAFKSNAPQCRKCDIPCNQVASLQYGRIESQTAKPCNGMCIPVPVPPFCLPVYGCPSPKPPATKREHRVAAEPENDQTVEAVPNPCVVCRTGIRSCQNKCNGDKGCENQCSCTFKKTLQCKECDISCDAATALAYDRLIESQAGTPDCSGRCIPVPVPPYCLPTYGCRPPNDKREETNLIGTAEVEKNPPCKVCVVGNKACQKKCGDDWKCKGQCKKAWMSVRECRNCIWEE